MKVQTNGSVTVYKNLYSKEPFYSTVDKMLERIKAGASKVKVDEIRKQLDKNRADSLKRDLPSVCFSGKFGAERTDESIIEHSGFIVLDFDEVDDLGTKMADLCSNEIIYAAWLSPRGNGIKSLVRIADATKHREHFAALKEIFPEIDKSGVNTSRVCFESYDPNIFVNKKSKVFTKIKTTEKIEVKKTVDNEDEVFQNILKWLSNKGDAFVTGERNNFIYKLASACCRFGIDETNCFYLTNRALPLASNSFSLSECQRTIKSAYRANKNNFSSASFDRDVLVDKVTRKELKFDEAIYDLDIRPKDVIFGEDVKAEALDIYDNGYRNVEGFGIPEVDKYFKLKRGEITGLSGIGNYGKSSFWEFLLVMRIVKYGNKFALFSPEKNSPQSFYHDLVEIILGADCTPKNQFRPDRVSYEMCYDFVSKHIFYVYPKELAPTPDYIKERFLELIIKEKVDGCVIDPFNQLANDYTKAAGRSDKYLETFLSDCSRFAKMNNQFFSIIMHPHKLKKEADGNYPAPDLYDIADGAMWNNKLDNLLIYHRPNHQKDPMSPICELHTRKIKDQKTVGIKGTATFELVRPRRRFMFDGVDYLQKELNDKGLDFKVKQQEIDWKNIDPNSITEPLPNLPF